MGFDPQNSQCESSMEYISLLADASVRSISVRRGRPCARASSAWPIWRGQLVPAAGPPRTTCGLRCSRCASKMLSLQYGVRVYFSQKRETASRGRVAACRRTSALCIVCGVPATEVA